MTEKITSPAKSKQKLSPYLIVLMGSFIASCIAMNLVMVRYQFGIFVFWKTLPAPPAEVESIIGVDTFRNLWIKSKDGKIYSRFIEVYSGDCKPISDCAWTPGDTFSEEEMKEIISQAASLVKRSNDCETLEPGIFPLNPKGQLLECVYSNFLTLSNHRAYFAFMKSGEILYWHSPIGGVLSKELLIFSGLILPIIAAIIITFLLCAIINSINSIHFPD